MFQRMLRLPRTARARWVVAAVLALTASLAVAAPAHAEPFPFPTDSFDGTPSDRWVADQVQGQTVVVIGAINGARTGGSMAYLRAWPETPTVARIYRTITPDDTRPQPWTCRPVVWLKWDWIAPEVPDSVQAYLMVRSGGPNGQVISVRNYSVHAGQGWGSAAFSPIRWQNQTFTIDIQAYDGVLLVDDLSITCGL